MALLWGGYTLIFWGFDKAMGYGTPVLDLVVPGRYKGTWPAGKPQGGAIEGDGGPANGSGRRGGEV